MVRVPKHDVLEGIARGTIKIDAWLQEKRDFWQELFSIVIVVVNSRRAV